jgi:DNA-binding CsgD family transcriptional regulator
MASGIHALTEKEKETLRLLVSGYDAKSMARQLGLSVHTINERLRDARRKMATSSSREAARLLREVEEQDPELLGD